MSEPEEHTPPHPAPLPRGEREKTAPRWTIAFLRALERTGDVRASAEDAGIDHSTAYARRRAHPDFASNWEWVLKAHGEAKARAEEEEIAAVRAGLSPPLPNPSPAAGGGAAGDPSTASGESDLSPPGRGEDLIASNGQLKRAGPGRWNKAKERIFFEELAATANARRAAAAVGLSKNAVLQRRLRHPAFAAKWDAVVAAAKASISLYLVEASNKTFDPEELDTGEVTPKVTIDQAIKISQMNASKARPQEEELPDPIAEEAASMTPDDVHELRERLVRKLQAIRRRDRPALLAQGWSYDEEHDRDIPPGWVKAPGDQPAEPPGR
jgi:hypothetical protein